MSRIHTAKPRTLLGSFVRWFLFNSLFGNLLFKIIYLINRILNFLIFTKFKFSLYTRPTVLKGPFKGLKYFEPSAACGPIIPRLLGTYESELFSFIEEFKKNKYTKIYDIGAAEGYYAVGFSLIFPETKIVAYETDKEVFEYLKKMVSFNNKDNQIILNNNTCIEDFKKIQNTERLFVLCDCEGFEFDLFNKEVIENLKNSDLIIEMHTTNFDKTIIEKNFSESHYCQRINHENKKIEIENYSNFDIKIDDFCKIYKENRIPRFIKD